MAEKQSTNLGKCSLVIKGAYDATVQYGRLDIVYANDQSYVCKKTCTGIAVTNTEYWQLLAKKGDTGPIGPTGATGAQGE